MEAVRMSTQKRMPPSPEKPVPKPLAWWKKLLITLFGTYIAAKFFGILVPGVSAAGFSPHAGENSAHNKSDAPTDEYPDDTWDLEDDCYEDEYLCEEDEPPVGDLYEDWDDWNEGYDDDHFS